MNAAATPGRLTVLIMAGGTGGHVYPALAVASKLRAAGGEVVWMGVREGLEADVVPRAGIEIYFVTIAGVRGKGLAGWLLAPLRLLRALTEALRIIWRLKPQVALGMGGFASGPGGLAAWLLRCPLLIHEQNSIPGLTNRLLAHVASQVMESFSGSFPAGRHAVHTGNPVRADIAAVSEPGARFAGRVGPVRILVLGGSQGAKRLNEIVPRALSRLPASLPVKIRHQTGRSHFESTRRVYDELALEVSSSEFIDDMGEAYAWADLAVCRAGAMTIAELAAAGVAAVLVPFPYAVDDHQTCNARLLCEAGAAVLVAEHQLEPQGLARLVAELCQGRNRLLAMATKARACALPGAADDVAAACLEAAGA